MKNVMKKVLAICVVASLGIVGFGCSSGKTGGDSSIVLETMDPNDLKLDLEFTYGKGLSSNAETDKTDQDAVETEANHNDNSSAEAVTEITTEYVEVTDAQGEKVTEADGSVQTEVVTVPVVVSPTDNNNNTSKETSSSYTPSYDICQAYFMNMTRQEDFVFDGEFLVLEFKIKEETPDGVYPVTVQTADIASWDMVTRDVVSLDGEVVVGDAKPTKTETPNGQDFTLDVDSVSGKQGDIVQVKVHLDKNPGFCAFLIRIQYDEAALEIYDTYGGSEFDGAVQVVG